MLLISHPSTHCCLEAMQRPDSDIGRPLFSPISPSILCRSSVSDLPRKGWSGTRQANGLRNFENEEPQAVNVVKFCANLLEKESSASVASQLDFVTTLARMAALMSLLLSNLKADVETIQSHLKLERRKRKKVCSSLHTDHEHPLYSTAISNTQNDVKSNSYFVLCQALCQT